MQTEHIIKLLAAHEEAILRKGFHSPNAALYLRADGSGWISNNGKPSIKSTYENTHRYQTSFSSLDGIQAAADRMEDDIESTTTPEEIERANFMRMLGQAIDKGKAIGVDVDFLNPLTETMKRLSENIIEHKAIEGENGE